MMKRTYKEALSEVDDIFNHLDINLLNRIPDIFREFVKTNKSETYIPTFNHNNKLADLPLKKETRRIISLVYFNYICDENEKKLYAKKLKENQLKKEEYLQIKYNPDNMFKKKRALI